MKIAMRLHCFIGGTPHALCVNSLIERKNGPFSFVRTAQSQLSRLHEMHAASHSTHNVSIKDKSAVLQAYDQSRV